MYRKRYGPAATTRTARSGGDATSRSATLEEPASERQEGQDAHGAVADETPQEALAQEAATGHGGAHVPEGVEDPDRGRLLRLREHPAHDPEKGHPGGERQGRGQQAPSRPVATGRRSSGATPRSAQRRGAKKATRTHAHRTAPSSFTRRMSAATTRARRDLPLPQVEGQEKRQRRIAQLGVEAEDGVVEDGKGDRAQVAAEESDATGQVERRRADPHHGRHVQQDEAQDEPVGAEGDGQGRERDDQVVVVDGRVVTVDVVAQQLSRRVQAPAHLEKREEVGVVVLETVEEKGLAQARVEDQEHGHDRHGPLGNRGSRRHGLATRGREGDAFRKAPSTSA